MPLPQPPNVHKEGRPRREIVDFDWHETSGVDWPANEEPGWALLKSMTNTRDIAQLEDLLKAEAANIQRDHTLLSALQVVDTTTWPDDIQKAVTDISDFLEGQYGPEISKADDQMTPKRILAAMVSYIQNLGKPAPQFDADAEVAKAITDHWPILCKAVATVLSSAAPVDIKKNALHDVLAWFGGELKRASTPPEEATSSAAA
jgi:hypothetical protein